MLFEPLIILYSCIGFSLIMISIGIAMRLSQEPKNKNAATTSQPEKFQAENHVKVEPAPEDDLYTRLLSELRHGKFAPQVSYTRTVTTTKRSSSEPVDADKKPEPDSK